MAAVLAEMGRLDESVSVLTEAVEATGNSITILANLAIALERQGHYDASIEFANRVLAVAPDHSGARLTLGLVLLKLGRFQDSVCQYQLLTTAHPENADAFLNLGEALLASDQYAEAVTPYARAIELNAPLIAARVGQGQALAMLERFDEADACFADSARIAPEETSACFRRMAEKTGQRIPPGWQASAREVFLSRRWALQKICDWRFRTDYLQVLGEHAEQLAASGAVAHDPSLGFQSLAASLSAFQRRSLLDGLATGIVAAAGTPVRRRLARQSGPLRIGFLSPDFREHPSAQVHWRQLALHDRQRFQIHAYSLIEERGSGLRQKVVDSVDGFHDISRATAYEAAWRIARDGIDILVDLSGYVDNTRPEILALRPAPIRVAYIASPVSLGKRLVDYRISDYLASPNDDEFTEAIIRLPGTHHIYNDEEAISDQTPTRRECGLPEGGFVFCAFNSGFKIEPEAFSVWMKLLKSLPGSVLWLSDGAATMRDNLRREAVARGIADERIIFAPRLPRAAHLARHACADLFLDTFFCNAHTTAIDALWAGLPVLTRIGDTMASRLAGSVVTAAGLSELVVGTTADYHSLAYRLATMPEMLGRLRQRLVERHDSGQLFNTRQKVRQLERGFEMMWERHTRGEPLASFTVPDDDACG